VVGVADDDGAGIERFAGDAGDTQGAGFGITEGGLVNIGARGDSVGAGAVDGGEAESAGAVPRATGITGKEKILNSGERAGAGVIDLHRVVVHVHRAERSHVQ